MQSGEGLSGGQHEAQSVKSAIWEVMNLVFFWLVKFETFHYKKQLYSPVPMGQQMVTASLPDCETLKIDGCAVRKKRVNVGLELAACPTILAATGMLNRHKLPESSSDRDVNIVGFVKGDRLV